MTHHVFIDESDLIWDAALNQTSSSKNSNKFYRIQIITDGTDYRTWTRWGRVGEFGQSTLLGDGSLEKAGAEFEKKFKDKSGLKWENRLDPPKSKKYAFIEKNYEDEDEEMEDANGADTKKEQEVESTLSKPVQNLMAFIFNQSYFMDAMASLSYDALKLPLGKLSKRTLQTGYEILRDLADLIRNPPLAQSKYDGTFASVTEDLSNRYFTTIPHAFGRNRPPVLNTNTLIETETDLLDTLSDMGVANDIMKDSKSSDMVNQLDRQFQGLGMEEMTPRKYIMECYNLRLSACSVTLNGGAVDRKSTEYLELQEYLTNSRGVTHNLRYSVSFFFFFEMPERTASNTGCSCDDAC